MASDHGEWTGGKSHIVTPLTSSLSVPNQSMQSDNLDLDSRVRIGMD
jgi:hypothetical protein